jgi:hypothetical protein
LRDHIGFVSKLSINALKGLANNKASENQFELHEGGFFMIVFHKKRLIFPNISKNQNEMKILHLFLLSALQCTAMS